MNDASKPRIAVVGLPASMQQAEREAIRRLQSNELKVVIEDVITVLAPFAPHCTSEYAKGWNTYRERLIAGIHQRLYPDRLDPGAVNAVMYPPNQPERRHDPDRNAES